LLVFVYLSLSANEVRMRTLIARLYANGIALGASFPDMTDKLT